MRVALLVCGGALLIASPVLAAPACNPFTEQEQSALMALIDLGVKAGGLPVAGNADYLAQKIRGLPACEVVGASVPAVPPKPETPTK